MHELVLYSQISSDRYDQVLHILAGVTGSQPVPIKEQHLVYRQLKSAEAGGSNKVPTRPATAQPQRLSYHRLIRDLSQGEAGDKTLPWRLRSEELPEPGVRTVISRSAVDAQVAPADLQKFQTGSQWYKFTKQFLVSGTRFVKDNVVIRIWQISVDFEAGAEDPLERPVPSQVELRLLDPSGAYLVEATIRLEENASSQLRDRAVDELVSFGKTLDGAIDLRIPDRLALDTRVKAG